MGAMPRRLRASHKVVPSRRSALAEGLEPAEDLAVAVTTVQAQGDDEPDHEPARQPRAMGAVVAGPGEDFFHAGRGMIRFRARRRSRVGQDRAGVGLLADVDQRSLLICYGVVANPMLIGGFLFGNPVGRYWL